MKHDLHKYHYNKNSSGKMRKQPRSGGSNLLMIKQIAMCFNIQTYYNGVARVTDGRWVGIWVKITHKIHIK